MRERALRCQLLNVCLKTITQGGLYRACKLLAIGGQQACISLLTTIRTDFYSSLNTTLAWSAPFHLHGGLFRPYAIRYRCFCSQKILPGLFRVVTLLWPPTVISTACNASVSHCPLTISTGLLQLWTTCCRSGGSGNVCVCMYVCMYVYMRVHVCVNHTL